MKKEYKDGTRIAKNMIYLFSRMFLNILVSLWVSRLILIALGVEDYGIYNLLGSVVVFFTFIGSALNNATSRFLTVALTEQNLKRQQQVFSMSLTIHLFVACLIFILSETIGLWFLNYQLVIPEERVYSANLAYQFCVLSYCLGAVQQLYSSTIVAHEKMRIFALTSVFESFLRLLMAYTLLESAIDSLLFYSILQFCISSIIFIVYLLFCKKEFKECHYISCWDHTFLKRIMGYSGWSLLVNGADTATSQSTFFFFNVFYGVAMNAALAVSNQVTGILATLLGNCTQAYTPHIIKSYITDKPTYLYALLNATSKISYYLVLLCTIPIYINCDFILSLWLNTVPTGTLDLICWSMLYILVDAYSAPLWIVVHATGNIKTHQQFVAAIKVLYVPLTYAYLVCGGEAWGVMAIRVLLNIICSIVRPMYLVNLINFPLQNYCYQVIGRIVAVTVISLPLPLYLSSLMEEGWLRLFTTCAISSLCIFSAIYLVGVNSQERKTVTSFMKDLFIKFHTTSKQVHK